MSGSYKPDGYSSVSAYVVAVRAQRIIDFLKTTFGAKQLRRFDNPAGSIIHVEVQIDDTVIMIADASDKFPAFPVWLHVYVPDADATYRRALKAGGTSVQELQEKKGDPDRRGGVKDPAGNTWWISTQITSSG